MLIERLLALATTLVLAATFPVAVIAVQGFRDAPFGSVLRPLPFVFLAFIGLQAPTVVGVSAPAGLSLLMSIVGVGGALVSAAHALVLLTERRKL
jgi:hypothetical protein